MENICVCLSKCICIYHSIGSSYREALSDIQWQYGSWYVEAVVVGCGADAYAKEMVVERVPYYQ